MRILVYLSAFLYSLHMGLVAYVGSSYVERFLGSNVGLVYALTSLVSIALLILLPRALTILGFRISLFLTTIGSSAALFALATEKGSSVLAFVLAQALALITLTLFDLLLESLSPNHETGSIRGIYIAATGLAWICAPLPAAWIAEYSLPLVFFSAFLVTLPALCLLALGALMQPTLLGLRSSTAHSRSLDEVWRHHKKTKGRIASALGIGFLLNLFYAVMVVYMPLHLRSLGMPWTDIGIAFTVMLLPFIFGGYPVGRIADRAWGETELMSIGFTLMALASFAAFLTTSTSLALWTFILFASRVGASTLEVAKESYFFKHIDVRDTAAIALSRTMTPLSYLIVALAATLILNTLPLSTLFAVLAAVLLPAALWTRSLRDTR